MKWTCQRGRLANQSRISLVLWVVVVHHDMDVETAGTLRSISSRNLRNSRHGGAAYHLPMTDPLAPFGDGRASRKERRRAVTLVVMAAPLDLTGPHRQHGLAAVERLDLGLLVHTQHDGMLGRRDVEADDIAHLCHEMRVGRELERLRPMRLQTEGAPVRCTLETDSPLSFAMPRELQWVASFGRLSRVFTMVASMRASSIVRGVPGLGSSRRPSRRSCTKRRRHLPTVISTTPSFAATSLFWLPSAHARTMRALNARACSVLRRPANALNSARSSSLRIRGARCRAIECSIAVPSKDMAQRCNSDAKLMMRTCDSGH